MSPVQDHAVTLSVRPAIGWGTRTVMVMVAVGAVALLVVRASSDAARSATLVALAPRPVTVAPPEVLASYAAFGYRQGSRQAIEVVTVGDSPVELATARAFLAMREAADLAGVALTIESGFRTHAEQKVLYRAWRRGKGNRAARPGESNHQSGRALDISVRNPDTYTWLSANAGRFGFKRTVASEPWHWEYVNTPRARSAAKSPAKKSSGRARGRRLAR